MTTTQQAAVAYFHRAFGHPVAERPTNVDYNTAVLRYELILEELDEYFNAAEGRNLVEVADALGDLLYVVYGAAVAHGIDLEPVFDEIHRSNMSKLGADGKPVPHPDIAGKIGKGPNYSPPDIRPILARQAA